jgi:hypothetical protein
MIQECNRALVGMSPSHYHIRLRMDDSRRWLWPGF